MEVMCQTWESYKTALQADHIEEYKKVGCNSNSSFKKAIFS